MDNRKTVNVAKINLSENVTICDPFYHNGSGLFNHPVVPGKYNCYEQTGIILGVPCTISMKFVKANEGGTDVELPDYENWEFLSDVTVADGYLGIVEGINREDDSMEAMRKRLDADSSNRHFPYGDSKGIISRFGIDFGHYPIFAVRDENGAVYAAEITLLEE